MRRWPILGRIDELTELYIRTIMGLSEHFVRHEDDENGGGMQFQQMLLRHFSTRNIDLGHFSTKNIDLGRFGV